MEKSLNDVLFSEGRSIIALCPRKQLGALDFTLQAGCKLQPSEQEGPSSDEMSLN